MIIRQDCLFSHDEAIEISAKLRFMMILDEIDVSPIVSMKMDSRSKEPKAIQKRG